MAEHLKPLDISHVPELLHLVEEVRAADQARVLQMIATFCSMGFRPSLLPNHTTLRERKLHAMVDCSVIMRQSSLAPPTVASTMLMLELKGVVRQVGGMSLVLAR